MGRAIDKVMVSGSAKFTQLRMRKPSQQPEHRKSDRNK
jgi:hypothetical protein